MPQFLLHSLTSCPFSRSCQLWSGTSRRGDRDWGASWSRSSTQWPWPAEDHPEPSSPPSLHSSSPSVSPPRSSHPDYKQNSNPQQYDRRTAEGLKQYTAKCGGYSRDGRTCVRLHVYVCVLSVAPYSVRARVFVSDWDTGHFHTCIHGETCQLTAFDYCGCWCLWFAWFSFLELCCDCQERFSESLEKELYIWRHWRHGPICDEPVERGSLGHVTPTGVTVIKDFYYLFVFLIYKCNQLPTLWSLATCITAEFAQFTETLQRKTI